MDIGVLIRAAKVMKERQAVAAWPSGAGDHLVTEEFPFAAVEAALQQRQPLQEPPPVEPSVACTVRTEASTAAAADLCRKRAEDWEAKATTVDKRLMAYRAYVLKAEEALACAEALAGDSGRGD